MHQLLQELSTIPIACRSCRNSIGGTPVADLDAPPLLGKEIRAWAVAVGGAWALKRGSMSWSRL